MRGVSTATPQCALQSSSGGDKRCALLCSPSLPIRDQKAADAQCGTNASCKAIQGNGICTYDDDFKLRGSFVTTSFSASVATE